MAIITKSDLKYYVEQTGSNFFDRKTLAFFGDTMANYGVRETIIKCYYDDKGDYIGTEGVDVPVYELYRKNPVKHGLKAPAYFSKDTFQQRHPIR